MSDHNFAPDAATEDPGAKPEAPSMVVPLPPPAPKKK